ncbi:TonB-dependent receptor [Candidatus Albibeggiatoa sp. nov. BB20]|uniref:TonB-dependent receptor plug domain-containing protein n=1 Tax=Candidatus Albibeggiatoa sp. nov. BB20 TaxID=3162723 RepID=UPI0033657431
MKKIQTIVFITCCYALYATAEVKSSANSILMELMSLSLEKLSEVEVITVSSASKKSQTIMETAAASYVITQEDIRRAGITNLPEALRLVPGIQVARIDSNKWAISARGFNSRFSSKLLVMIDGRAVYTPLRSEVNWDSQDVLLEDVERIEVIRGPGASLWGANAVNGIINVITKQTCDTQGGLVSTTIGSGEEKGGVGVRYGGKLSQGHYRVYGKLRQNDNFMNAQGNEQHENWGTQQIGLRIDQSAQKDTWGMETEYYESQYDRFDTSSDSNKQVKATNFHLLGRWKRDLTDGDMQLQSYYTHTNRDDTLYKERRDLVDIDFQHSIRSWQTHEIIWGLGFRYTQDDIQGTKNVYYSPEQRKDSLFSAFIQHEWQLAEQWRFTWGTKLEHNNYTGFEIQPTVRMLWSPDQYHSVWGAVSRAVKTPSRTDSDFNLKVAGSSIPIYINGNNELDSETLIAYELGYRFQPNSHFFIDSSLFFHDYDDLIASGNPSFVPYPEPSLHFYSQNNIQGHSYGAELSVQWQATTDLKIALKYNYLKEQESLKNESYSAQDQANLQIYWNIRPQFTWDNSIYYMGNVQDTDIEAYTRWDTNLGWKISRSTHLNIGIHNILDKQHHEFVTTSGIEALEIPRSFYLKLQYTF